MSVTGAMRNDTEPPELDQTQPDSPSPYQGKPRGRPKGAKNRPKPTSAALSPAIQPLAVGVDTTAVLLSLSESMVWKLIRAGERGLERGLESRKIGKKRLVLMRSIRRLLGLDPGE